MGPFKAIGMKYVIEPLLLNKKSEEKTPDIVASGESGWMVLELTLNSGSKSPNLRSYSSIDPRFLAQHGLYAHDVSPDVVSSRLSFIDDGPYCQLVVRERLEVMKEDHIHNQDLKSSLIMAAGHGYDLKKLPSIPISFLPEMRPDEIRIGLIDIVMQLFKPGCNGKSLADLLDDGLERLSDSVSITARKKLKDNIRREMNSLVKDTLKGYLIFEENESEGIYKATDKFKGHPKTMERIALELREWAGIGPQKTLDLFLRDRK